MNKRLLESKMKLYGDTTSSLAAKMKYSRQTITNKKNGRTPFTTGDIEAIRDMYNLSPREVVDIFFSKEVP